MTRLLSLSALFAVAALAVSSPAFADTARDRFVDDLLARMTLEEKAGQLNMVSAVPLHEDKFAPIARGLAEGTVGALYNAHGLEMTRALQAMAGRSRLGIPLLLALDVSHGYRTIFPTPLAQAASFDMAAIEQAERIAAAESTAEGLNVLLTPMLDVSRDPRWGRVVEGPGESSYLASRIAEARVKGVEGASLAAPNSAAACAKHFGANGAVEGGRDYTAQDVSERAVRETYLPPFRAAVAAGVHCLMAAFNAPDGAPTVVNARLLTDVLRREWGFEGVVTSDFEAIDETVAHGVAADQSHAAAQALAAGADVDMQSMAFVSELPRLVRDRTVPQAALDRAVRRVLALKAELGLFDDPMRGATPERSAKTLFAPEHRASAQALAEKSFVLLKNEEKLLPLSLAAKRVALIGPFGDSAADTLGPWAGRGEPSETVTLKRGLEERLATEGGAVAFTPGGDVDRSSADEIAAAVETARRADVVVLALGEKFNHSGEGASRASLALAGDQHKLADAVLALGKPTVAVIFAGRPLALTELAERTPAILYAWQPGTMGGTALARTLFGDVNPSGRLPMTFPRAVGQIPIHHDMRSTGRPADVEDPYTTGYRDETIEPLYPFGHGLGYADFSYGDPKIDRPVLRATEVATVSVAMTNTGKRSGVTVAQLYVRPKLARLARPVKELRGFARVELAPGETKTATFRLAPEDFGYWLSADRFEIPTGAIEVMTGPDADAKNLKTTRFDYRP